MARRHWPWDLLGIDRTADKPAIRRAYATRLKAMDVDRDIQGFAELRYARDQALRDADYADEEDADFDPLMDAEPDLLNDLTEPESDGEPVQWTTLDQPGWSESVDDFPNSPWDNQFGYGTGDYADPDSRIEHIAEQHQGENAPDRRLARLLFPGGAQSDEGFTHEEHEAAQAALNDLLSDAKSGDLGREQAVDFWLAEMLADGWPRSGPLVDQAAETFGWLAQSGEIGERPALQFLNPRVRGMRFVAKVEQAGHPLHKVWEELKRPGKAGFVDRFRIKRDDVETLLGGIRTRYPEVESYLDHERVASWEKPAPSWVAWIVQRLFIAFVLIQAVALCGRALDNDRLPQADIDRVVAEAFGPGRTMAELKAADPAMAELAQSTIDNRTGDEKTPAEIGDALADRVRVSTAIAMQEAPKADVLAILAVRRDLFEAAGKGGTAACIGLLTLGGLPDTISVPEDVRAEEQALAWRLAKAKLLRFEWKAQEARSLPLPSWVGPGMSQRSGLPAERINAVLSGKETDDLCAVRIALIDTLLSRPEDAPVELLRIM